LEISWVYFGSSNSQSSEKNDFPKLALTKSKIIRQSIRRRSRSEANEDDNDNGDERKSSGKLPTLPIQRE
jgi:hypothetical protein